MAGPAQGTFSKVPLSISYSIVKDPSNAHEAKDIPSTYGRNVRIRVEKFFDEICMWLQCKELKFLEFWKIAR